MPKYCPSCGEEFEDWVEACPDCGDALAEEKPAPDPAEAGDEAAGPTEEEARDYRAVWRGAEEDGTVLAGLLRKEGVPVAVEREERAVDDETEPATVLRVPPEAAVPVLWFLRGFERAVDVLSDEPGPDPQAGGCCGR